MKSNLSVIRTINDQIIELKPEESNQVIYILNHSYKDSDEKKAKKIADYLSTALPVKISADLVLDIINE